MRSTYYRVPADDFPYTRDFFNLPFDVQKEYVIELYDAFFEVVSETERTIIAVPNELRDAVRNLLSIIKSPYCVIEEKLLPHFESRCKIEKSEVCIKKRHGTKIALKYNYPKADFDMRGLATDFLEELAKKGVVNAEAEITERHSKDDEAYYGQDVFITDGEQFMTALYYDREVMKAPLVTAKFWSPHERDIAQFILILQEMGARVVVKHDFAKNLYGEHNVFQSLKDEYWKTVAEIYAEILCGA